MTAYYAQFDEPAPPAAVEEESVGEEVEVAAEAAERMWKRPASEPNAEAAGDDPAVETAGHSSEPEAEAIELAGESDTIIDSGPDDDSERASRRSG